jgi:hypothetical protein
MNWNYKKYKQTIHNITVSNKIVSFRYYNFIRHKLFIGTRIFYYLEKDNIILLFGESPSDQKSTPQIYFNERKTNQSNPLLFLSDELLRNNKVLLSRKQVI